MKEKYADQDEEEREMKLALLGSKQKVKGFDIELHTKHKLGTMYKNAADDSSDENDEENEGEAELEQVPVEITKEEVAESVEGNKTEEGGADVDFDIEGDEEIKIDEDDKDDEAEIQKLIKEEDINLVPEDLDVSEIDKLTGIPRPGGKFSLSLL